MAKTNDSKNRSKLVNKSNHINNKKINIKNVINTNVNYIDSKIRIILILIRRNNSINIDTILDPIKSFIDAVNVHTYDNFIEDNELYLNSLQVPLRISNTEWKNYGYNRNLSFTETVKFCNELKWNPSRTYGLILDSDQKLIITQSFDKENIFSNLLNGYNLSLKVNSNIQNIPKVFNLSLDWVCDGMLHEYWSTKDNNDEFTNLDINQIYIETIEYNLNKSIKDTEYDKIRIILISMIKNESAIIERALGSIVDFVDAICVCDTGSTDSTVSIINNYFKTVKIPTRLCNHTWKNFGYNRSLSFTETVKFCKDLNWNPSKTYGLLLDADQKLVVLPSFDRQISFTPNESGYNLMLKTSGCLHHVPKFINLGREWNCVGSTHEYWTDEKDEDGPIDLDEEEIYIDDVGDGGCKSDKYERDIRLLLQDLEKNPEDSRTIYYLGQSHYDTNNYEEALKWFEKRLKYKGTDEEVYNSYLNIAISVKELDKPESEVKAAFEKCMELYPYMLEPIYYFMEYYISNKKWIEAFEIGKLGLDFEMHEDYPFITEYPLYEHIFKDDMLLVCLKTSKYGIGVKLGNELLNDQKYDEEDEDRITENYNICLEKLIMNELNMNDINIIILANKVNDRIIQKINDFSIDRFNVKIATNDESFIDNRVIKLSNDILENKGWYNLMTHKYESLDKNISLLDIATYYAYINKFKYVWIIDENVEYNNLNKILDLLKINSIADLITTPLSHLYDDDNLEDEIILNKILDMKTLDKISDVEEDWESTLNGICRISYRLLKEIDQLRIEDRTLYNNEYCFSTLCNRYGLQIDYLDDLEIPISIQMREQMNINESDKEALHNNKEFESYISVYCRHSELCDEISRYYKVDKKTKYLYNDNKIEAKDSSYRVHILFDQKIKLTKSDNIVINALKNKNIKIDINNVNESNYDDYDHVYDLDSYISMTSVLKDILECIFDTTNRLLFLENLFKNEEIVIMSAGPSVEDINSKELKYITDNYITICVKYVLETLLDKNIKPTFFVYNSRVSKNNINYYRELSKDITTIYGEDDESEDDEDRESSESEDSEYSESDDGESEDDESEDSESEDNESINDLIKVYPRDKKRHLENFKLKDNLKLIENNIDCITWTLNKDNNYTFSYLHSMCELAIPLCIHLGISKIYTAGWDLKDQKNLNEFDNIIDIKKILNSKNISIFKIKNSPISLDLKNIC